MGHTPVVAMQPQRTSLDVTTEPLKEQMETFLDEHRAALREFAQHCGHADILRKQILGPIDTAAT
jgi:Protein of unknown function (DUF664)